MDDDLKKKVDDLFPDEPKPLKTIHPVIGILAALDCLVKGRPHRNDILRLEKEDYIIDTCCTFDTEMWETGVSVKNENGELEKHWDIVEQYENREKAVDGHKKWIKLMEENPKRELPDLMLWDVEIEEDDD